ncbi:MAG TPA: sugar ABC transporter ATP-binding protein [Gaiellaceae bacterium]
MALLEIRGVRKSYPGVTALAGVGLAVDAGEVHALLGENGAGKSTLMKVVAGSVVPDEGSMTLDGGAVPFGDPERAREQGIGIVYQELSLVPQLTVGENVFLGRWPTRVRSVDWRRLYAAAGRHLARVGLKVDPRRRVDELGMAERQLVEIAKALSSDVRVLLLDEPTSALSEREARRLFDVIRGLKESGVAVVYVSHRLAEVLAIADRITVLRDGRLIDTVPASGVDEGHLARLMVGRALASELEKAARDRASEDGRAVLRARGLARSPRLKPVDLELRAGEIVGVFGLVGAGRTRLARALFGLDPPTEGTLELFGRIVSLESPSDAIRAGMGYLGEDRSVGIVPRMSVAANVTLASLRRIVRGRVLDFRRERRIAQRFVDDLSIRVSTVDQLADTLSGGNQQKLVLARWLCSEARVLVLDDPTRGIDVGAKEEVFRLVRRLAGEGTAILYLTSEIREARTLPHRLLVMAGGRVVGEMDPATPEEEIMRAAGGVSG